MMASVRLDLPYTNWKAAKGEVTHGREGLTYRESDKDVDAWQKYLQHHLERQSTLSKQV